MVYLAVATSITTLIERARRRADMVGSKFVTDTEITDYVNQTLVELYDELIQAHGEDTFRKSADLTLDDNGEADLPNDWMRTLRVEWSYGQVVYSLAPADFRGQARWGIKRAWSPTEPPRYSVRLYTGADDNGVGTLCMYPAPYTSQTVTLWYIPVAPVLKPALEESNNYNPLGYDEILVLGAVIRMLAKEESPTADVVAEQQRQLDRIRARAVDDRGLPPRVSDLGGWGVPVRGLW